jgi:hypothetical protein
MFCVCEHYIANDWLTQRDNVAQIRFSETSGETEYSTSGEDQKYSLFLNNNRP